MSTQICEHELLCHNGMVHYGPTLDFAAAIAMVWPSDGWTRKGIGCGPHKLKSWAVGVSRDEQAFGEDDGEQLNSAVRLRVNGTGRLTSHRSSGRRLVSMMLPQPERPTTAPRRTLA